MIDLNTVRFGIGTHDATDAPTGDRDLCIMEAVAFVAGEPWSDAPTCASPVISTFLRTWQDVLSDEDRDRLLPAAVWVPRLVGSRGTPDVEEQRAWLVADWLFRIHTPAFLDLTPSLRTHAEALRSLPAVTAGTLDESAQVVRAAWEAAWEAATTSLRPTVETLQHSALDLLDRMLACGREEEG